MTLPFDWCIQILRRTTAVPYPRLNDVGYFSTLDQEISRNLHEYLERYMRLSVHLYVRLRFVNPSGFLVPAKLGTGVGGSDCATVT